MAFFETKNSLFLQGMLSLSEHPKMLFRGSKLCKVWARQLDKVRSETQNLQEIRSLLTQGRRKEEFKIESEAEFRCWSYDIVGAH